MLLGGFILDKLKKFANQFVQDGTLATNVEKTEDGYSIHFLENDRPYCLTTLFKLYTFGPENEIGFIEHNYGPFTKANAADIKALVSLIGAKVPIEDKDVVIEIEFPKEVNLVIEIPNSKES